MKAEQVDQAPSQKFVTDVRGRSVGGRQGLPLRIRTFDWLRVK